MAVSRLASFLSRRRARPRLPSFPTRRSSDLCRCPSSRRRPPRPGSSEPVLGLLEPAADDGQRPRTGRSEEHTSELQSLTNLVCRLLLEKKKPDGRIELGRPPEPDADGRAPAL